MRRKSIVGRSACQRLSTKALLKARFRYPIQAKTSKPLQPEHELLHCLGVGSKIRAGSLDNNQSERSLGNGAVVVRMASARGNSKELDCESVSFEVIRTVCLDSRAHRRTRKSMPWRTISETKLQEVVVRS